MDENVEPEWQEFFARWKEPHLEREAVKYWRHAEAVDKAEDFETLKRVLSSYFRYRAEQLRAEFAKANPPEAPKAIDRPEP